MIRNMVRQRRTGYWFHLIIYHLIHLMISLHLRLIRQNQATWNPISDEMVDCETDKMVDCEIRYQIISSIYHLIWSSHFYSISLTHLMIYHLPSPTISSLLGNLIWEFCKDHHLICHHLYNLWYWWWDGKWWDEIMINYFISQSLPSHHLPIIRYEASCFCYSNLIWIKIH